MKYAFVYQYECMYRCIDLLLFSYDIHHVQTTGNKIPAIENFGVLMDKYDSIDLSDNEIRKFDNFPMMVKVSSFLLNNNLISKIGEKVGTFVVINS